MTCDKCGREIEERGMSQLHNFSGYGFWVKYHPECCPRQMDGSDCELEHPDDVDASPCDSKT
jgi:hypothetical protein